MKKRKDFIIGFLCAASIFGGTAVLANSDVIAKVTSQVFFWNNEKIELNAYSINDSNYVKLRDAAKIFGVDIAYDEVNDSVYLGMQPSDKAYLKEKDKSDGRAHAREDFSQYANPEIFNDIYTKDAYNAIKQTLIDTPVIVSGTNAEGYNPSYEYANFVDNTASMQKQGKTIAAVNSVISNLFGYHTYSLGSANHITNIYEHPGYRICQVWENTKLQPAKTATDIFITEIKGLSDAEKVKRIANLVCDKIVYSDKNIGGINDVFTNPGQTNGNCATYASAFQYLCERSDIPCVMVADADHGWNEVYVDGKWFVTDIGYYDVGRPQAELFITNYWKTDISPQNTKFAKELLVPMSTK